MDMSTYSIITVNLVRNSVEVAGSNAPYARIEAIDEPDATPEMLEALEARTKAKEAQDKLNRDEASRKHAEDVARITAELRAKYPNADNRQPGKNLKAELVKAFRVLSSRFVI